MPEPTVPPILFKYLSPERLDDVLTNCRVRFSQRTVFSDDHELQPDYAAFGTEAEIERHIHRTGGAGMVPGVSAATLARLIAQNPEHQRKAIESALKNIKSYDALGILCLTDNNSSERMWSEYADKGRGFVIGFDSTHPDFRRLVSPMGIRKVSYTDEGIATFLGMMEKTPFEPLYRKRMDYSFEREWRSIRLFKNLERYPGEIYLSPFESASVRKIVIGANCGLETQLREIAGQRYQHVEISKAA